MRSGLSEGGFMDDQEQESKSRERMALDTMFFICLSFTAYWFCMLD